MNNNVLKDIYPDAELKPTFQPQEDVIIIPVDEQWLYINKNGLSPTEIKLLTTLYQQVNHSSQLEQHVWYRFLFNKGEMPDTTDFCRIIQFRLLEPKSAHIREEWLSSLENMFEKTADCFFITDEYGLLVEQQSGYMLTTEDLTGILLTLESEMLVKAVAFIGLFFPVSNNFPEFFKTENRIFSGTASNTREIQTFSVPDTVLAYLTEEQINQNHYLKTLKNQLAFDEEFKDIIQALWQNQGNITSAAKQLYIHRNTLQYRLDKFYERTGLSLKKMDDLVLCYILL